MTTTAATASKTKGVLSLVFGIVSIVFAWILPIVWLLVGVAAVVLGVLSRKQEPGARTLALWGIILGAVGIVLNILSMVAGAILISQAINGA